MHRTESEESAVSEIIGAFLMVALTVIMGAVIAALVMGMADGAPTAPMVVVMVTPQPDGTFMVTYHGGPDHPDLASLTVNGEPWEDFAIGGSKPVPSETKHIVVTGQFHDAGERVVLDTTIG
jgi:FlaG/FlaF family flagellin (archaellin)